DRFVDLDAARAGRHERRVGGVPDVLHVHQQLAALAEEGEKPGGLCGRRLRPLERIRAAGEVVVLNVDDHEAARHPAHDTRIGYESVWRLFWGLGPLATRPA